MNGILGIVGVNALGATLLAAIVVIATPFVRRPAVVHGLWLLVLVELLSLPVLSVAVPPMWSAASPATTMALVPASGTAPEADGMLVWPAASTRRISWEATVTATWLGGALFVLALAVHRGRQFNRLLQAASPAPVPLATDAARLATRLGVSGPDLRVVPAAISPMLWFPGRSLQLLFPEGLLHRLEPPERQAIVAHELAHVRRRDHWVRWFELLVGALYWWHPVVWWARRTMRKAEEESCDAWVMHVMPGHARAYAEALLKTAEFLVESRTAVPVLACGIAAQNLKARLTMIVTHNVAAPSSRRQRLLLALSASVLLVVVPTIGESTNAVLREQSQTPVAASPLGSQVTQSSVSGTAREPNATGGQDEQSSQHVEAAPTVQEQRREPPVDSPLLLRTLEVGFPTTPDNRSLRPVRTYIMQIETRAHVSLPSRSRWMPYADAESVILDDAERLWMSGQFESLWVDVRNESFENDVAAKRVIFSFVERRDIDVPAAEYPTPPPEYQHPPEGDERLYPPPAS